MKPVFPVLLFAAGACLAAAEEEYDELQALVVKANADSAVPRNYAGSAEIIDEKTIEESGARSIAELLSFRAGIRVTNTTGNRDDGNVSLRGFGENSASRVLILVDGKPVNRPDMAGVSLREVSIGRISRIEILRGSQSARFGDNAVGGVINVVTKEAGTPRSHIETAVGSFGYQLLRSGHEGVHNGNAVNVDFEQSLTEGYRDNAFSESTSMAGKWKRDLGKNNELELGISWADLKAGFPGPLAKDQYLSDPTYSIYAASGQADQYFYEQKLLGGSANLRIGRNSDFYVDLPLGFSAREQASNLGPGSHTDNKLNTLTFDPVLRREWRNHALEVGTSFRYDSLEVDQFSEIQRWNETGNAELERVVAGIFIAAEWEPIRDIHLSSAVRANYSYNDAMARSLRFPQNPDLNFQRSSSDFDHAYQLGLRWEPRDDLSTWLRFDQLYRLPSTDELASYQGFPLTVPFNDELFAETGQNIELGAEFETGNWTFRGNGFVQFLQGEIVYDFQQNLNTNFADTQRMGVELDMIYQANCWEAGVHYSGLRAEYQSGPYQGRSVSLVPNHQASVDLIFRPSERLSLRGDYRYISSTYEGNDFENTAEKLSAYGLIGIQVRYEITEDASVYLSVDNLLDKRYAALKYSGVYYPGAGRSMSVGMKINF
ncbi:TonB-dependent receptor [Luteolibacter algae]|uniref:TonB-dependent receptor n=1 Tax=Luteolibacter algae TaxID=454151 RepID=A0ABW5D848_9BACT